MRTIREDLDLIGIRLGEAWEAFTVERIINETANKESNPALNALLGKHAAFWNTHFNSLRTMTLVGLCALVEKHPQSVTFFSVLREVRKISSDREFAAMDSKLNEIHARYEKFRHELYAHNARARVSTIAEFDAAGFTWPAMEDDFRYLDYVWKALRSADEREPIPSDAEAHKRRYPHNDWVAQVAKDTKSFLANYTLKSQ